MIEFRAYAKVNLSLDVLGSRHDGFHELRSVMQTISLHDTLRVELGKRRRSRPPATTDYSLIDRAIEAVQRHTASESEIAYNLTKRIPPAAGLGGGSSDCASAIRATSDVLGADLATSAQLQIASALGSDVPFFLVGGTALVEGRGERVTPLPDAPTVWFLLAREGTPVSTRAVFADFVDNDRGDGQASQRTLEALQGGSVVFGSNDLTLAAIRKFPEIGHTFDRLAQVAPAERIAMSGSGGVVMAMFENEVEAKGAKVRLKGQFPWLAVASSVSRPEATGEAS